MPPSQKKPRIALITGASSGIGADVALLFAKNGVHVILTARRLERLREIEAKIASAGGKATIIQADLSQEDERLRLLDELNQSQLFPDVLVNNAGLAWYGYFHEMPWTISRDIIDLNIAASTHMALLFLPAMVRNKYGFIINIGSIAGKLNEQGIAIYSASKAYLDAFTTCTHRELKHSGVHISVIRAGPVRTEFFDTARKLPNGGAIPAERFAIPSARVAKAVWSAVKFPRKVIYVPFYMFLSPLLEVLFSSFIDLAGPLLLKRMQKTRQNL
ncbi:MAG TPA: SDR family NAD(P)-dependent oxidoreductase [Anaerolineaceae bacterium]|nr:SDR family NAD(P)-dependent oxidoreductase [Anaerolineaceae bacterium]